MSAILKRKRIRIEDFDYSTPGAYFITVCTANREKIFWKGVGADIIRPQNVPLSPIGNIVEQGILQMVAHYDKITVDKYCVMPDHIHLILRIESDIHRRIIRPYGVNGCWVNEAVGFEANRQTYLAEIVLRTQHTQSARL